VSGSIITIATAAGLRRTRAIETDDAQETIRGNHIQVSIINLSHRGPMMATTIATIPVAIIDSDDR
jgi:hypothetical protein